MTVDQAIKQLQSIGADGHGRRPLKVQLVVDGVAYAQDVLMFCKPYDGAIVWVIPKDEVEQPAWLA